MRAHEPVLEECVGNSVYCGSLLPTARQENLSVSNLSTSLLRSMAATAAITVCSGCATYRPHEVDIPGEKSATALGTDDLLYLRLLRLRKDDEYKALYDTLARELDERKEKDVEGCIHAAGDLATISLERGWLDSASLGLQALRECHKRLVNGQVADTFISEDYVKLWGISPEGTGTSPTIRCNTGHCKVKMVSNYFSWSRPLEDFNVKGEEGQRKGLAVVGAIIGTPFLIGPMSGYRNTRAAFRGTVRYERPSDPKLHMRRLIASLAKAARQVEFTAKAKAFHGEAADVFASIGSDGDSILLYRLQAAFAYSELDEATRLIARHAGTTAKIEALEYSRLVAQAPPSLDRTGAMHIVEPYYYDDVSGDLSEEATARYLAAFPDGERSAEVRAIQASLVEFRTKVAGKPRALVSFWNRHRGDALGKLAIKPLQALVKANVKVLDPHIYVTNGDGSWVDDVVEEMRPNGVYGGERFNVFLFGEFVNSGNVELPVRLICHVHMWKTITVRALLIVSSEKEPISKSSSFVANLPPKKPQKFVCLLKNQREGGGISAGLLGGIDGSISFRDPPAYLEPTLEEGDISAGEVQAQEVLVSDLFTKGNVAAKVNPRARPVAAIAAIPEAVNPTPVLVVDQPFSSNYPSRSNLPEKLTLEDIKDGTREPKEAASRRCKALARPDDSVSIKLSISGPDGKVVDATPVGGTKNVELAECVARELKAATFRPVQKPQSGAQIKVTF